MREIDIRLALFDAVRREHGHDPDTLVIEELGLCEGAARVDFAVVNGQVHGFEIKSAQDTLTRLPGQSEIYSRVLDRVTVVVDEKHLIKSKALVPKWWGVLVATTDRGGDVVLRKVRIARNNPKPEPYAQAQLLWRSEALEELVSRSLASGLRSKPRREIWERLATSVPQDEVAAIVRSRLKSRSGWRVESRPE